MKSSLVFSIMVLTAGRALAYPISTDLFYLPGNNVHTTRVPGPDGTLLDGVALLRTEAEMAAAITTYSGLPPWAYDNQAGITILVMGGVMPELHTINLTVGPAASAILAGYAPAVFTDVFGIYRAGTFGFAGGNWIDGFGIEGTPIRFAADRTDGQGHDANRFLTAAGIAAGYRASYISTPLHQPVPEGGSAALLLALGVAGLVLVRRA